VKAAHRRRLGALVVAAAAVACGHRSERVLVDRFFTASRQHDKTAAQAVATVFFDPGEQGLVRDYAIRNVTPEEESGGVVSKTVTLTAAVEGADGLVGRKTIVVTMQRRQGAAWKITGVAVSADPSRQSH